MEFLTLVFLHVVFGIVWAGGAISTGLFILPAVLGAGPAGGAVMAGVAQRKYPIFLTVSAIVTVLAGARLYMIRYSSTFLHSPEGIVLTLGAVLALGAFFMGVFVQKPTVERIGALAATIAASGAPPTPAQAAELQALRAKLARVATLTAWHLIGAVTLMAFHRLAAAF